MRAYRNIKFINGPDVRDIQSQGRKSVTGRIVRGESYNYYDRRFNEIPKVCHNDRGYCAPKSKAAVRRSLKRIDRALENRFEIAAEA
jgi:hypothetical protein